MRPVLNQVVGPYVGPARCCANCHARDVELANVAEHDLHERKMTGVFAWALKRISPLCPTCVTQAIAMNQTETK